MTRKEAQFELDKSRQQIYRLILIYLNEGKEGFIHKNRGKVSKNKIDKNIIEELEQLSEPLRGYASENNGLKIVLDYISAHK